MAMATLSLVPTPSALETSTGSFHFLRSSAKSAPKLPMPPRTPGVKVRLAWWRMRCLASSATAIFPPASAYFMRNPIAPVSGLPLIGAQSAAHRSLTGNHWSAAKGCGSYLKNNRLSELKRPENPVPAHDSWMQQGIRISKESFANLSGLPGSLSDVEGHVNQGGR